MRFWCGWELLLNTTATALVLGGVLCMSVACGVSSYWMAWADGLSFGWRLLALWLGCSMPVVACGLAYLGGRRWLRVKSS